MRQTFLRTLLSATAAGLCLLGASRGARADEMTKPTLTAFAKLPALTFLADSEPSGAALGAAPINGVTVPFSHQPIQGFSGIVPNGDGSYQVLSDNGYAYKNNSADFLL